jgi:hypothetical protein
MHHDMATGSRPVSTSTRRKRDEGGHYKRLTMLYNFRCQPFPVTNQSAGSTMTALHSTSCSQTPRHLVVVVWESKTVQSVRRSS